MVTEGTKNLLKNLGLNSYEAKIWAALLSNGQSTAGELSDIANVPRSRSYDVLESLEKKGFVVSKKGKPARYLAFSPGEAINNIRQKSTEETRTEIKRIEEFKGAQAIKELKRAYSQGPRFDGHELSGVLKGEENIQGQMAGLLRKANQKVIISMEPGEFKIFAARFSKIIQGLKDRKINVEIIQAGNAARFCIIDGKEFVFVITDEKTYPSLKIGIWIRSSLAKDMDGLIHSSGQKFTA